jgi:hypothetical protein
VRSASAGQRFLRATNQLASSSLHYSLIRGGNSGVWPDASVTASKAIPPVAQRHVQWRTESRYHVHLLASLDIGKRRLLMEEKEKFGSLPKLEPISAPTCDSSDLIKKDVGKLETIDRRGAEHVAHPC